MRNSQWQQGNVTGTAANLDRWKWYKFELVNDGIGHLSLTIFDGNNQVVSVSGTNNMSVGNFTRLYFQDGDGYYVDDLEVASYTPDFNEGMAKYDPTGSANYGAVVRAKVCDPAVGVESNCQQYSQGWKPEGLMQEYSDRIRYSVFGYLNDREKGRDGGVLRASQRFIGLRARDPETGWGTNSAPEWDANTGVLIQNPDSDAASATATYFGVPVADSGAMNYINKFGELNNNQFKTNDPVSELYYTATRYFRGLESVPEYSTRSPAHNSNPSNTTKAAWVDGFPVVRTWEDPIQYSCQKNVILGIGDVYTHNDQNLPGRTGTSGEPGRPSAVSDDTDVDVEDLNGVVGALEGLNLNNESRFGATRNAGYMIGLAFDARTRDIRDDLDGKQSIETYWVDVLENQILEDVGRNQFWLTAKYGGLTPRCPDNDPGCELPEITGPHDSDIPNPLPDNWWFTNGEVLTQSGRNLKRADNYFPAGQADDMVEGLKSAFEDIAASLTSTATAVSFNSDQLQTDSLIFQALFDTNLWSGDLIAIDIDQYGNVGSEVWSAADKLDGLTSFSSRKIYTAGDFSDISGGSVARAGRSFSQLTPSQLDSLGDGSLSSQEKSDLIDYIQGDRSNESAEYLRPRASRMGDIVNSSPQYLYHDDFGYSALSGSLGTSYTEYRESSIYQNKPPVVVVGANDGMLHVFDASEGETGSGTELFGYVPSAIIENLHELANPDYLHRYYVDGTPRLGDAWLGNRWATLAVGTTGAGGNSIFALDISNPDAMSSDSVLWEFTNDDMGRLVQQPSLVSLANGKFGVVVSSGYETTQDEGYVWVLDAADGSVIAEVELPTAGGELGAPLVVDLGRDRVSDRIYVGDTEGNLWRIDIDGSNANQWDVPNSLKQGNVAKPLFIAKDSAGVRQPITAPLSAALNGNGDPVVLFGTGSFHEQGDEIVSDDPQIQSFYGIYDEGNEISDRSALLEQDITREVHNGNLALRTTSRNTLTASNKGWFMDLFVSSANGGFGAEGERVVSRASLTSDLVVFSTLIPSADPCAGGGSSWFLALDYNSGSAMTYQVFDVNGDGEFDVDDGVDGQVSSGFSNTDAGVSSGSITDEDSGGQVLVTTGSRNVEPETVNINDGSESGRIAWRELMQ
ncbi:pilus assembly protein [Marinobacterium mangrovicola]|uniref:pilus assembly protein n=1 Tax=Marinobacterium mangrovicola TaxID=1476959 RepID=UPI00104D53F5|nr:PilC/PilY family type IV pilus protein [Marinobacterium mangrovicola]